MAVRVQVPLRVQKEKPITPVIGFFVVLHSCWSFFASECRRFLYYHTCESAGIARFDPLLFPFLLLSRSKFPISSILLEFPNPFAPATSSMQSLSGYLLHPSVSQCLSRSTDSVRSHSSQVKTSSHTVPRNCDSLFRCKENVSDKSITFMSTMSERLLEFGDVD